MKVICSTQTLRAAAVTAACAALSLSLVSSAAAAPNTVGPSGNSFYTPSSSKINGGKHGDVIWSRAGQPALALTNASKVLNVVYKSKSLKNKNIAVSGTIWVPKGTPPAGGWPVISWGHGTTGSADICAPSRIADTVSGSYTSYVFPTFNQWLGHGYAIEQSDYEGLGTAGPHPYLVGHSEGRGMIDIVKAGHKLDPKLSTTWVASGHSQGGHAALFAASDASSWGSGTTFKGVAAFAPANSLKTTVIFATGAYGTPNGISGLGALIVRSLTFVDSKLTTAKLFNPAAQALLPDLESKCLGDTGLGSVTSFGQFAPGNLLKTWNGVTKTWTDPNVLRGLNDLNGPAMDSDVSIKKPILILQGLSDDTVPSFTTDSLVAKLKTKNGAGNVGYATYTGIGHGPVVDAGKNDAQAFFVSRFGH